MTGKLDEAIKALLVEALPALFAGAQPPVQLTTISDPYELDTNSAEATGSEPRPDDQTDDLPFDRLKPAGPYTLSKPPIPGPRRVRLTTALKDRIALRDDEVLWNENDPRRFTLKLRPERDLAAVSGVQVLYSIVSVFVKLKFGHSFTLQLQSQSPDKLEQSEALALAVIALNRQRLVESSVENFAAGNYAARVKVTSLRIVKGAESEKERKTVRLLNFRAEVELKATRALAAGEGKPIERIRTAGLPADARRPVDIRIDVEA